MRALSGRISNKGIHHERHKNFSIADFLKEALPIFIRTGFERVLEDIKTI